MFDSGFKGTVKVRDTLCHTSFVFGDKDLITGKELLFIKQDKNGDCDCMWGVTGIITIDSRDIEEINYNQLVNPQDYIADFYDKDAKKLVDEWIERKLA